MLVLTTFGEDGVLWGALEAGAAGFVLKASSAEELIAAVRATAGGAAWFDPAVAPRILEHYRRQVAPASRQAARLERLTDREREVLRLIARGATNSEIATTLIVAAATVKTHIGSIFGKLGVRDRAAAIVSPTTTGLPLRVRSTRSAGACAKPLTGVHAHNLVREGGLLPHLTVAPRPTGPRTTRAGAHDRSPGASVRRCFAARGVGNGGGCLSRRER